jgi:hypothetical protein
LKDKVILCWDYASVLCGGALAGVVWNRAAFVDKQTLFLGCFLEPPSPSPPFCASTTDIVFHFIFNVSNQNTSVVSRSTISLPSVLIDVKICRCL